VQQICDRIGIISEGRMVAEHDVEELRGQQELVIRATPMSGARTVLHGVVGADAVHLYDDTLRVKVESDRAAEVNRALVEAGIAVSELRITERALEDVFFELTASREARADAR
jgi:ABC-2 type transport system ATP-binding protein